MLTILLAAVLQRAQVPPRPPDGTDPRDLMVEAIDAPDGSAHGVLKGEMAAAIARGFRTDAPINIDVTTLKRYRQPGCSRLNVAFTQDGVQLPGGLGRQRRRVDFGIDYCRDGRPPSSHEEDTK